MKIIKLSIFLLISTVCFAQKTQVNDDTYGGNNINTYQPVGEISVNGIPISKLDAEYIMIVGTVKLLSQKVVVEIDFGQEKNGWTMKDTRVVDSNGKNVVFNSIIDALNFMNKQGYFFLNAYAITVNNQNVYHYLMQRYHNN